MKTVQYEFTKNQLRKIERAGNTPEMPTDEEFQTRWAKSHHGKTRGWGMMKRDWILSQMRNTREYQLGIWQGRVDAARRLEYTEDRPDSAYNLGYHQGYCG